MPDGQTQSEILQNSALKNVVCTSCDGFCPVAVKVDEGQAIKVTTRDHPLLKDVLCMKGAYAPKSFAHPSSCLLYTSPSPRDRSLSRMPSSA